VIGVLFGAGFTPPRGFAALTGFTVLAMTGCLLLNQVPIARGAVGRLLPPWLASSALAVALIVALDGTPTDRVAAAVAVAVGVALLWLTAVASRPLSRADAATPG
jgi:uncharacterized membrane protein YoaK (UPF0700 family)